MKMSLKQRAVHITRQIMALLIAVSSIPMSRAHAVTDDERTRVLAARLQTSMTAIEDTDRDSPRDRWDPDYVVQTVGIEPEKLYAWVIRNITWEPYRGVLRGATGVLMDRRGNSIDQALLLAALLRGAGKTVRLAHAELTPSAASELWSRLSVTQIPLAAENYRGPLTESVAKSVADSLANAPHIVDTTDTYGMDRSAVTESIKSSVERGNSLAGDLNQLALDQTPRLLALVGLPDATAARAALNTATQAALVDHWWIQMKSGSSWVDIDPLAPEGKLGAIVTPAKSAADPDAIPEDLKHTVTVRVVVQQWKDGQTAERVPLEKTFEPRDVIGVPIELLHSPAIWPEKWPEVTKDDVQIKLRAAVYTQTEWQPILLIGNDHFSRASIKDSGDINEHPSGGDPFRALGVSLVGNIQKAADVVASGGDPDAKLVEDKELKTPNKPRPEGELVAEWLEFETHAPGMPPQKVRRQVFDILGPAARGGIALDQFTISEELKLTRSTAVLEQTEIMILPSALAPEYLVHLLATNALDNKDVLGEVSKDPFSKLPPNYVEIFSKLKSLPSSLYAFAGMRLDSNPEAANLFIDRPLIVLQHGGLARGGGGDFFVRYALDIVDNALGVDPRTRRNPAELRLRQGVVDTNTEAAALRLTGQEVTANSAESFSDSLKSGNSWTVLRPGEEAKVASLKLPPDPSARITADLKAGNVVVALSNPGPDQKAAWWRIDPVTGTTLGIGADGSGQALVEYALVIIIQGIINTAQCMLAGAATKATEAALKDLDDNYSNSKGDFIAKGVQGLYKSTVQGAKAGAKQAKESLKKAWEPGKRHHCFAMGMMGAFDAGLMIANFELAKRLAGRGIGAGGTGNEPVENKPPEEQNNDAASARQAAERAAKQAEQAKSEAERSKSEAEQAKSEAEQAKSEAEAAKKSAEEAESKGEREPTPAEAAEKRAKDAAKKLEDAYNRNEKDPSPENKEALDKARDEFKEADDDLVHEKNKEEALKNREELDKRHAEEDRIEKEYQDRRAEDQKALDKLKDDYTQANLDKKNASRDLDQAIKNRNENPTPENQEALKQAQDRYAKANQANSDAYRRVLGEVDANGNLLPPGPGLRQDTSGAKMQGAAPPPPGQPFRPQSGDTQIIQKQDAVGPRGGTGGQAANNAAVTNLSPLPQSPVAGLSELESVLKAF